MKNSTSVSKNQLICKIFESITEFDKNEYNLIQTPGNPFLEYNFLYALEASGSIGRGTGWDPRYIVLYDQSKIIAALTFFVKTDSYGEYIFDWEWARAYYNAGLAYYPKAVVGVPFTPATGEKILVDQNYDFDLCGSVLIEKLLDFCCSLGLSSAHFLFITEKERLLLEKLGFLSRLTHQYHWHNRNYKTFDDFLSDLRSGRRKQIRKERKKLYSSNINFEIVSNDQLTETHRDIIWQFYINTNSKKWGNAYLNKNFFDIIFELYRERTVLVFAKSQSSWLGGTINFFKNKNLYGRYWGCLKEIEFLHFECCYYKLIEFAIENGMEKFEAGAQGEHKFLRGFSAVPINSSHYFFNKGAHNSISDFLKREIVYNRNIIMNYNNQSPLKHLYGGKI
ncbi:MAG: GNAT family N-acetyltransferase [Thermodesulfobacteriota bacterium]